MKSLQNTNGDLIEHINSPAKRRDILKLVPARNRTFIQSVLQAHVNTRDNPSDQLARYYTRLAHSVVSLESEEVKKAKELKRNDPVAWFRIGAQGSRDQNSPLGVCAMRYFNYSEITAGLFSGDLSLEPQQGGVTFTFLKGLPLGATVSFWLNWSTGNRKGVLSPACAVPQGVLSSHTTLENKPDFQWTIVRKNTQVLVCIRDNNPEMGTIAAGVDCRVSYY